LGSGGDSPFGGAAGGADSRRRGSGSLCSEGRGRSSADQRGRRDGLPARPIDLLVRALRKPLGGPAPKASGSAPSASSAPGRQVCPFIPQPCSLSLGCSLRFASASLRLSGEPGLPVLVGVYAAVTAFFSRD